MLLPTFSLFKSLYAPYFFLVVFTLSSLVAESQSCPTYDKRNNGQGTSGCYSPVTPPFITGSTTNRKIKSGQFDFTTGSTTTDLILDSVFLNGQLYQAGGALFNSLGTIWFGSYSGSNNKIICFYGDNVNDNAPPAGRWKFRFTSGTSTSTTLSCNYTLTSGGALTSFDPGTISGSQTICSGTTPNSLTSGGAATGCTSPSTVSYQWRSSTDNITYANISGATSTGYSPGTLTQTTYYQRVATCSDGATAATDPVTVTVVSSLTWLGTTNDFATSSNWNTAISPAGCAVVIPTVSGANQYPVATSSISVASLTINSGAQMTISGTTTTLSVTGDFSNNGVVSGSGKISMAGTSTQTISGIGTVDDISINNNTNVTVASGNNKLNITGTLSFPTSTGTLTTNSNLVLKSSATSIGTIGSVSGCPRNPFNGDIIAEKYIPGSRRSFRFLTPGLTTTTSIYYNWQEGSSAIGGQSVNVTDPWSYPYVNAGRYNPNPGYGTHITGSRTGANGLDATATGNPSLFTHNNSTTQWSSILNTLTPSFKVGEAYQLMVRGSRATDLTTNTPAIDNTTLRVIGVPEVCVFQFNTTATAQYTVPLNSASNAFSFIGNPFWSVIDWHNVTRTGIDNTIYYWDPTLSGSNGRGAYVTYNVTSGGNNQTSRLDRYIQPGQGFFVKNSNQSETRQIIFEDADKVTDPKGRKSDIFRLNPIDEDDNLILTGRLGGETEQDPSFEKIYVTLTIQGSGQTKSADGLAIVYSPDFTDQFSAEDAPKPTNLDENLEARYNNQGYSILGLKGTEFFYKSDTIDLRFSQLYNKTYVLSIDLTNKIGARREVYLWDRISGEKILIPVGSKYDYVFTQPASQTTKTNLAIIFNSMKQETAIIRPQNKLMLFPNPATDQFRFLLPGQVFSPGTTPTSSLVQVYSSAGSLVMNSMASVNQEGVGIVDIRVLPKGSYTIKLITETSIFSGQLIKQ